MQIFPTQIWTILHLKNYLKENHWSDWSEIFCAWSLHPFVSIHKFSCSYHISFIQKQLRTTNLFFGTLFWMLSYIFEALKSINTRHLMANCLQKFRFFFRKTIDFHEIVWKYFFLVKCFKWGLLIFFQKFAYLYGLTEYSC